MNGHHVEFSNGNAKRKPDKDHLHPSAAEHAGNTGYKTRLRSRKSQAGVN